LKTFANQAAQITNATKEQAHGVEDIIKSVANAREQVKQIFSSHEEQAVNADKVIGNVEGVTVQANEVADAAKVQANEVEQLAKYTSEIDRVLTSISRMLSVLAR